MGKRKEDYSSEEVRAIYSEIINKYIQDMGNVLSTDASVISTVSGIGILEIISESSYKFKVKAFLSSVGTELAGIKFASDIFRTNT